MNSSPTAMLDFDHLPDNATVEYTINQLDKDDCVMYLHHWRERVQEGLVTNEAQNRAMILVTRRFRALREAPKKKATTRGAGKKAGPTALSIDEL